jgi:transposase InsO family protein
MLSHNPDQKRILKQEHYPCKLREVRAVAEYINRLYEVGARISMAATGNPYQNAFAESFMKTLKTEEVYLNDYQTLEEARANIELFFDRCLQRATAAFQLAVSTPDEFEQLYYQGLLS